MPRRLSVSVLLALTTLVAALQFGGQASAAGFSVTVVRGAGAIFEPGIDIGLDGTIIVNGPTGVGTGKTQMWRSDDDGATYKPIVIPSPYNRMPGGGDGDVVIGPDKQIYMMDLWLGSNSVLRSADNGATWTQGTPVSTMTPSDRQWIALGPKDPITGQDTVYAIFQWIPGGVWFSKSIDGGLTWTTNKGIISALGHGDQAGQVVAEGERVATAYHSLERLLVATSNDRGETWTESDASLMHASGTHNGDMAPLAMEGDTLVTAWTDALDNSVWVARSEDFGATWRLPVRITSGENSNAYPWIDMRGGKIALTWYGGTTPGDPDAVPDSNVWNVMYSESLDGGHTFSDPVVALPDVKHDQICLGGLSCNADRELGDFFQIAIHPQTLKSYIVSVDVSGGKNIYVARQN